MKTEWLTDEKSELTMSWEHDRMAVAKLMPDRVKELDECIETCRYFLNDSSPAEARKEWKDARYRGNKIIDEMIIRSQSPVFVAMYTIGLFIIG